MREKSKQLVICTVVNVSWFTKLSSKQDSNLFQCHKISKSPKYPKISLHRSIRNNIRASYLVLSNCSTKLTRQNICERDLIIMAVEWMDFSSCHTNFRCNLIYDCVWTFVEIVGGFGYECSYFVDGFSSMFKVYSCLRNLNHLQCSLRNPLKV